MAKHSPGPWMSASAPSSVVGWPVVGQKGRAIASVHCMMQKPPHVSEAEFQSYRDECEANARLIGNAPRLKDALAAMLDCWGGYECPEVDAAIAVMQDIGEDRWSMQAQMEAAKDTTT